MQFFGGIRASGRIIHESHALRMEQMPRVVTPHQRGEAQMRSPSVPRDKIRGRRFAENIDWGSLLSVVRQGIAVRRRRVAPALLLC